VRRMSVRVLREMADLSSGLGRNAFLSTVRLFGFFFSLSRSETLLGVCCGRWFC
jgi:hypothetical protein